LASENDLGAIAEDAQLGRIDVCHDARWPDWRFAHGEDGRLRLEKLKALADGAKIDIDANDPYTSLQQRWRVAGLASILSAVLRAPDRTVWRRAFATAQKRLAHWRGRAAAVSGDGLPALTMRRALWNRGRARIAIDRLLESETAGDIQVCMLDQPGREASYHFVQAVIAVLDGERWPTDVQDDVDTALTPIALVGSSIGSTYLAKNWPKLEAAAAAGRIPAGALALLRVELAADPTPPASLGQLLKRFDAEWGQIAPFLATLPPAPNVGAELTRSTRLEQYGRRNTETVRRFFVKDSSKARADAFKHIWQKVEPADIANTQRMKVLLQMRDWFDDDKDGEGAESNGWLIVQHSDLDPDFQRDVLRRLEPLLPRGRVRPSDYALLWDRVAVKDNRLQRYGTQLVCKDGKFVAQVGVEDPESLDERRKAMGLGPWREYAASFGPCS
jgi:hypothetical protein